VDILLVTAPVQAEPPPEEASEASEAPEASEEASAETQPEDEGARA
jgi:hypothetical protein